MNVTIQPQKFNVSISKPNIEIGIENQIKKEVIGLDPHKKVNVSINQSNIGIVVKNQIAREVINIDPYTGEYIITPNNETQILYTKNYRMLNNVVVNPIPNNYGLITWNGSFLMIT